MNTMKNTEEREEHQTKNNEYLEYFDIKPSLETGSKGSDTTCKSRLTGSFNDIKQHQVCAESKLDVIQE